MPEGPANKVLYFAYGHHMSSNVLRAHAAQATPVAIGYVHGHQLTFAWTADSETTGKCHAEPTQNQEDYVWGVVWEMPEVEKAVLDALEGLGRSCAEKEVVVITEAGETPARMYYATNPRAKALPSSAYRQLVLAGAREHRLPDYYCKWIEGSEYHVDPAALGLTSGIMVTPAAPPAPPPPLSMKARWETPTNMWNLARVPEFALDAHGDPILDASGQPTPNPGRSCAVFVVHGIGRRQASETSAGLRSGFEDALDAIKHWQESDPKANPLPHDAQIIAIEQVPPPFVFEGFWSDYQNGETTFKNEWAQFNEREKLFFNHLWTLRASVFGAFFWFWRQLLRLFGKVFLAGFVGIFKDPPTGWKLLAIALFIYLPLQFVGLIALLFALIRVKSVYQHFLLDVRMYLAPKGCAERAIVENIDRRVGKLFMKTIGLDLDFMPLPDWDRIEAGGKAVAFDRVVWVAHSLGTVISYNVLSRLFHSANELEAHGTAEQRNGVARFRQALTRFVTLGSPLDKIAFLFPELFEGQRAWPTDRPRRRFLTGGEREPGQSDDQAEWWINFYHVLDPISGPINSPLLCGPDAPNNYHLHVLWDGWPTTLLPDWPSWLWPPKWATVMDFLLPGYAHVQYWSDMKTLRYILGRTFGRKFLFDQEYVPMSDLWKNWWACVGYVFWMIMVTIPITLPIVLQTLVSRGYFTWGDVWEFIKQII